MNKQTWWYEGKKTYEWMNEQTWWYEGKKTYEWMNEQTLWYEGKKTFEWMNEQTLWYEGKKTFEWMNEQTWWYEGKKTYEWMNEQTWWYEGKKTACEKKLPWLFHLTLCTSLMNEWTNRLGGMRVERCTVKRITLTFSSESLHLITVPGPLPSWFSAFQSGPANTVFLC